MQMIDNKKNRANISLYIELLVIFIFGVVIYFLSEKYDLFEKFYGISRQHENWQVDGFLSVSIYAVIVLLIFSVFRLIDITISNKILFKQTTELRKALSEIKQLRGIIPICASCKKIKNDKGLWQRVEAYLHEHADAELSHGFCPDCLNKLYPESHSDEKGTKNTTEKQKIKLEKNQDPKVIEV